jgi:hypothetical protein
MSQINKRRIKLPHKVIVKAPGLLPMKYKVSELSKELNIPNRTLRDWLIKGAPHQRDNRNHIWIIGTEFALWIEKQKKPKRERKLNDNEAFCFKCKKPVDLINPEIIPKKGKLIMIKGKCSNCNITINRGGRNATTH